MALEEEEDVAAAAALAARAPRMELQNQQS
jgi:hypothetical protein